LSNPYPDAKIQKIYNLPKAPPICASSPPPLSEVIPNKLVRTKNIAMYFSLYSLKIKTCNSISGERKAVAKL